MDTDQYLLTCYRYIELNPVRAGLVGDPRDFRWSSHGANAFGIHDPLVTAHERYLALGRDDRERQTVYRALFRERLDGNTLTAIREATNKGWALGNDKFMSEIEDLLRRRARPLPRGGSRRRRDLGEEAL